MTTDQKTNSILRQVINPLNEIWQCPYAECLEDGGFICVECRRQLQKLLEITDEVSAMFNKNHKLPEDMATEQDTDVQ